MRIFSYLQFVIFLLLAASILLSTLPSTAAFSEKEVPVLERQTWSNFTKPIHSESFGVLRSSSNLQYAELNGRGDFNVELDNARSFVNEDSRDYVSGETSTSKELLTVENGVIDCLSFEELGPPPSMMGVPPPPLPHHLEDLGLILREAWQKQIHLEEEESMGFLGERECPLCEWSKGDNRTLIAFTKHIEGSTLPENPNLSASLWGGLVVIAFLSGLLGAILTGFLLRCKRKDVVNICGKATSQAGDFVPTTERPKERATIRGTSAKQPRAHSSSECDRPRPESVQNTYTESPYVSEVSLRNSAVYAEINTPPLGMGISGHDSCHQRVICPVASCPRPSQTLAADRGKDGSTGDETIYINDLHAATESSGGSSSAYYSDASGSLAHMRQTGFLGSHSGRRRKKKRSAFRYSNSFVSSLPHPLDINPLGAWTSPRPLPCPPLRNAAFCPCSYNNPGGDNTFVSSDIRPSYGHHSTSLCCLRPPQTFSHESRGTTVVSSHLPHVNDCPSSSHSSHQTQNGCNAACLSLHAVHLQRQTSLPRCSHFPLRNSSLSCSIECAMKATEPQNQPFPLTFLNLCKEEPCQSSSSIEYI